MVEAMKSLASKAVQLLVLGLPALAAAQELSDPTRPPARLASPQAADSGTDGVPVLQSVLVGRGPGARRIAVIDGDTVREGDSWRGARVARIAAGEVVLAKGKERQVLHLATPVAAQGDLSIARIK